MVRVTILLGPTFNVIIVTETLNRVIKVVILPGTLGRIVANIWLQNSTLFQTCPDLKKLHGMRNLFYNRLKIFNVPAIYTDSLGVVVDVIQTQSHGIGIGCAFDPAGYPVLESCVINWRVCLALSGLQWEKLTESVSEAR